MRNGVGIRADRKRAGLRRVLCDRLVIDDLAALANHDSVGLLAALRQRHMERDRRVLEFRKRRNGKALRLAARNGKLARRALTTKLRGGVGVGTSRQRDGRCAACRLKGRAGFLVREHKGRALGSKRKVHSRELFRLEVFKVDVAAVIVIVGSVLEPQHIVLVQVHRVGFPLCAGLEGIHILFVDIYLQQILAGIAVRNRVEAQLDIVRRGKAQILRLIIAGNAF